MTIRYKCEECGAVLNIKDELLGTQGHCPRCQAEFTVTAAPEEVASAAEKPAVVAGEPSAEKENRPAGAFGDDEIADLLGTEGPGSATSSPGVAVAESGFDAADDEVDEAPRRKRRKPDLDDSDAGDDDAPSDADDERDDDDFDRSRKKKRRSGKGAVVKSDSSESASIAKNLMGRGDRSAPREEKKRGRLFGGAGGTAAEQGDDFSAKEVAGFFLKKGGPILLGGMAFMGLCYWISSSLMTSVALPPLAAPISGTVTLDGKPLVNALVEFQPVIDGPRPNLFLATSVSYTDTNGNYSLVYTVLNERQIMGAVIGKHLVTIKAIDPQGGGELLPPEYSSSIRSILKQEVVKGGKPIDFPLLSSPNSAPK